MASVWRSAFCAILTSGVLLACAIDKSHGRPPAAAGSAETVSAVPESQLKIHTAPKIEKSESVSIAAAPKPVAPKPVPQKVEIYSHPTVNAEPVAVNVVPVPVTPAPEQTNPLGNPQAFLPIPDPHIDNSPAAVAPPSNPPAAPAANAAQRTSASATQVAAQPKTDPVTGANPAVAAGNPSPYQRAMLGNKALGDGSEPGKLQGSFVFEVIFIFLIIACLAGAAWYRMNFDFGRNSRKWDRRR